MTPGNEVLELGQKAYRILVVIFGLRHPAANMSHDLAPGEGKRGQRTAELLRVGQTFKRRYGGHRPKVDYTVWT
ncbi:hypothetical protein FHS29_004829 [Saccharothrix tamanrassetensis]|uniref:Uncharacterized protein n=1 Tax=Saccharothrix tamanrassetensis TaxID=1051531 RepID=A0A841CL14_9PSEU|nr:hypothetical protein [Saccharothrix tamanrassetensis]MBB5958221.1 hypothetical protein [Saccharothrix tamanrassetensis]